MIKLIRFLYSTMLFSLLGIWFWSNFFIGWSRFCGVTKTIRLARRLARAFPLQEELLDSFSKKADLLLCCLPFLFLDRKQGCLIRGFLLYFYGKRLGLKVRLHFGSQWKQGKLRNHCWIVQQGVVRYEVEEVIRDYVTIIEYC